MNEWVDILKIIKSYRILLTDHFPMAPLAPGNVPPNGAPNAGPYRGQPMAHPAHMVIPAHMLPEG